MMEMLKRRYLQHLPPIHPMLLVKKSQATIESADEMDDALRLDDNDTDMLTILSTSPPSWRLN